MKKIIAWLLVLALTAAVSIGATLAYLMDTDEGVNVMTLGKVKIEQLEYERIDDETENEDAEVQEFQNNKPLYPAVTDKGFDYTPGDSKIDWTQIGKDGYTSEIWDPAKINNELDKMVFAKNTGDYDAHVRSVFAFEAAPDWSFDDFESKVHLNLNDTDWTWEWIETPVSIGEGTYFVAVATYNDVLKPGAFTEISLSQIALDSSATNEDLKALGGTYNVLVKSQAIQADGFADAATGLNEGFGAVTADAVPFTSDQPPKGIDVRSALRFYQGDVNQPIHTEVTNVVFGLSRDYPAIVNGNTGTLVTEEQNGQVYAYYVQEDGKYTVYFLSNGQVYLPSDSSSLFMEMTALTGVDTSNLNTSRAEKMDLLFHKCAGLTDLDVSGFDTSKATTMYGMFYECTSLPGVDVSNWDTSNVTDMGYMFRACNAITELDVTSFDVSKVENMAYMFSYCPSLQKVNADGWDTRAVTSTRAMFLNDSSLSLITGTEDWRFPNNTSMYYMFQNNIITSIDVSNWDCGKVTDMPGVFYNCQKLETITGLETWNTSSAKNMGSLFYYNKVLKNLDGISGWNTSSAEDMSFMFKGCLAVEELNIGNWDTGNVKAFNSMFSGIGHNTGEMKFTELPIEDWDMSSATNIGYMFYGCGSLTKLDLHKWDVSKVTTMRHTFADCNSITEYNFTGWNTESLQNMDGIFNSNKALVTIDVSDFDTENVTDFRQVFDGCTLLENIEGLTNWDTSKGIYFGEFLLGSNMVSIDLSSFNMSSAKYVLNMFHVNPRLTTIYVGDNWNLNPATLSSPNGMFGSSTALKGANGNTTGTLSNSAIYARVDTPETPGLLTHINDKPVNP